MASETYDEVVNINDYTMQLLKDMCPNMDGAEMIERAAAEVQQREKKRRRLAMKKMLEAKSKTENMTVEQTRQGSTSPSPQNQTCQSNAFEMVQNTQSQLFPGGCGQTPTEPRSFNGFQKQLPKAGIYNPCFPPRYCMHNGRCRNGDMFYWNPGTWENQCHLSNKQCENHYYQSMPPPHHQKRKREWSHQQFNNKRKRY